MFRPGIFLLLAAVLLPLSVNAGEQLELSKFRTIRHAELPRATAPLPEQTYAVNLDEFFFQTTENPVNDICITDSSGKRVPFVLKKVSVLQKTTRENQLTGKIVRNQQLPDGRNAVDFELNESSKSISSVELVGDRLPAGAVLSLAIGDGKNWQFAVNKLVLSDINKLAERVNRRFPLPKPFSGKIVRVILEKGSFPALEAVRVFEQQILEPAPGNKISQYNLAAIGSKSEKERSTIVYSTNYTPLTSLKLEVENKLYLNKVTILGSNDRRKWNEISSSSIRCIDLDKSNVLNFPESRYRFIMLRIEHVAAAPVIIRDIKAYGPAYHWLINGGKECKVLTIYCNPSEPIPPGNHQTASETEPEATYILSAPQSNKLHKTGVHDRSSWNHLAGALLVIFAFAAVIAITGAVKRSEKLLPED